MGLAWPAYWTGLPAGVIDATLALAIEDAIDQAEAISGRSIRRASPSVRKLETKYLKALAAIKDQIKERHGDDL